MTMGVDGVSYTMNSSRDVLSFCFFSIFRYALERTCTDINIWFWPRSSYFVPLEVKWGLDTVDPDSWVCENHFYLYLIVFVKKSLQGIPVASFPNTFCDFSDHFDDQNIIINLTLCKLFILFCFISYCS